MEDGKLGRRASISRRLSDIGSFKDQYDKAHYAMNKQAYNTYMYIYIYI